MKNLHRVLSRLTLLLVVGFIGLILWDRFIPPAPPTTLTPIVGKIDRILVEKSARKMTVFQADQAVRTYKIALGFAPDGDKEREGDGKTPEGIFKIDRRNGKSAFHLSLGINYPQPEDTAKAAAKGLDPGGDIFIHGQPNTAIGGGAIQRDWTAGCIAVSDAEIEELWAITPIGVDVEIRP